MSHQPNLRAFPRDAAVRAALSACLDRRKHTPSPNRFRRGSSGQRPGVLPAEHPDRPGRQVEMGGIHQEHRPSILDEWEQAETERATVDDAGAAGRISPARARSPGTDSQRRIPAAA